MHLRYFDTDYEFIEHIGELDHLHDFDEEAFEYAVLYDNRSILRRRLRQRISIRRLRHLVKRTLHSTPCKS